MNRSAFLLVLMLLAARRAGAGQSVINGSAEVDAGQNRAQAGEQVSSSGSFGQSYSLGFGSALWDPRLLRYSLQGTLRTQSQNIATDGRPELQGHLRDLGYAVGANFLPASVVPFFVQASRLRDRTAGDLALSNQSGIISPAGVPAADYEATNQNVGLGWHVGLSGLPIMELGYQRADSLTTGGGYQATQSSRDFSGSESTSSSAMHQSLRYQTTSNETVVQRTFGQRLGTLDFDFGRTLGRRSRLTARAGRRTMFSRSIFEAAIDPATGAYAPGVTSGSSGTQYAVVGYAWDPNSRVSLRADGKADRQTSELAATAARLASLSGHFAPVTGLDLTASGTGGTRQQVVNGSQVSVLTRSATGGISYDRNARYLGAGASASRTAGTNSMVDGRGATIDSWSADLHVTGQLRALSANAGYGRSVSTDPLLDFGNYDDDHLRGSVQMQMQRGVVSVDASDERLSRGQETTLVENHQRTLSATASFRPRGRSFLAASAGRFFNDYSSGVGAGSDRNMFWNVSFDSPLARNLQLTAWLRSENAAASRTQFTQDGLSGFARLDYRLRTLKFQFEFRKSRNFTHFPSAPTSPSFIGRQIRFSISRQFGAVVR